MTCDVCGNELFEGALFCGECGSSVSVQAASVSARGQATDTEVIPQFFFDPNDEVGNALDGNALDGNALDGNALDGNALDGDVVSVVDSVVESVIAPLPLSFTVTLSSGESLEIFTAGLIGRMPQPAAGEVFDHLIVVADPARSVSKTHLEVGIDGDQLWVLDRHSGNGSIIRESGKIPRRAEPGQRYVVSRGTRVDVGDQHILLT